MLGSSHRRAATIGQIQRCAIHREQRRIRQAGLCQTKLFAGGAQRLAFVALRDARCDVAKALRDVDAPVAAVLERASVADPIGDPIIEVANLVRAAVRRTLLSRSRNVDAESIKSDRGVKQAVERLGDPAVAVSVLPELLTWLNAVNTNEAEPTSRG